MFTLGGPLENQTLLQSTVLGQARISSRKVQSPLKIFLAPINNYSHILVSGAVFFRKHKTKLSIYEFGPKKKVSTAKVRIFVYENPFIFEKEIFVWVYRVRIIKWQGKSYRDCINNTASVVKGRIF